MACYLHYLLFTNSNSLGYIRKVCLSFPHILPTLLITCPTYYTAPVSLLIGIVSIMSLSALAYERYIRVVHATVVDFPWVWRAITHIWLYSLVWTGAPLLGWNRYKLEIHQLGCSLDWASKDPNDASFILFFLLACFFVPVGIMIYCYGNILYTVRLVRTGRFYSKGHSPPCIYLVTLYMKFDPTLLLIALYKHCFTVDLLSHKISLIFTVHST